MSSANVGRNGTCVSFLVLLAAFACFAAVQSQTLSCDTGRYLNDAGYFGIQQQECEMAGFCWSTQVGQGQPRCFVRNGGYNYCSAEGSRYDCGFYGINQSICEARGCCWATGGGPWCFFPNSIDPQTV